MYTFIKDSTDKKTRDLIANQTLQLKRRDPRVTSFTRLNSSNQQTYDYNNIN